MCSCLFLHNTDMTNGIWPIYTGHTQNNGAVSIVIPIKTAPFFCVYPVYIYIYTYTVFNHIICYWTCFKLTAGIGRWCLLKYLLFLYANVNLSSHIQDDSWYDVFIFRILFLIFPVNQLCSSHHFIRIVLYTDRSIKNVTQQCSSCFHFCCCMKSFVYHHR